MSTNPTDRFRWLDNPWMAALAFALFAAGNAVILSQVARFDAMTGGVGMLELPTQLGGDLRAVVASYPADAVRLYRTVILPLDIVYPATAGFFFATLLAMGTRRAAPAGSIVRRLPWLGLGMVLGDWLENVFVFWLLGDPHASAAVDTLAQIAIGTKVAVGLTTVCTTLAVGGYALGGRVLRGRWPADAPAPLSRPAE